MFRTLVLLCLGLSVVCACSSSGEGGRQIDVTQADDGCTPKTIDATPGEKLDLKVTNNTGKDYEVEGINGTNLEEVIIPGDRTRDIGFSVPSEGGLSEIKCYVPGDVSTIIQVQAAGGSGSPSASAVGTASSDPSSSASETVSVGLKEFEVTAGVSTVNAGTVKFTAKNNSSEMVHELAVLRVKDDGSFENMGEVEDIDPGASGEVTIDLAKGKYQLACLITPGEAGSTVDHYKQGMHTDFEVK